MPYVSAWKMEVMAENIFQKVWKEHKDEMLEYFSAYNKENASAAVPTFDTAKIEAHKKAIADTQEALRRLETIRGQNLIPVEKYTRVSKQYQARITHEQEDMERPAKEPLRLYDVDKIKNTLEWNILFPDGKVSADFLDRFVARIISIDGELFVWD